MKDIVVRKENGVVDDLQLVLQKVCIMLNGLRNGDYEISIRQVRHQRSIPQNKLLWMWLNFIADETGNSKDDLKDFFSGLFLRREIKVNGKPSVVVSGTSTLNRKDMTQFLENIQKWCAEELGMQLPQPEELIMLGYEQE